MKFPRHNSLAVLATDVNPLSIERARKGQYGRSSLKEVDASTLKACFKKVPGSGLFEVRDGIKSPVRWQVHGLFSPMAEGLFHIILLRNNLLTYHRGRLLEKGFGMILSRLMPKGYIVVGAHERIPSGFEPALRQNRTCPLIYQYLP